MLLTLLWWENLAKGCQHQVVISVSIEQVIVYVKKGILTLCWLSLGLYVFVILASYSPNDPSWSHISTDMAEITNMGGTTGAWLADILLSMIGLAAYWLVLMALYEAALIWWERRSSGVRWALVRAVSYLFLLMSSATLLYVVGLYAMGTWFGQGQTADLASQTSLGIKSTGVAGYELGKRLQAVLGTWGSFLFSLLFIFALMTMTFDIYWRAFFTQLLSLQWRGSQQDNQLPIFKAKNSLRDAMDKQDDEFETNQPDVNKTNVAARQIPLPLVDRQADKQHKPINEQTHTRQDNFGSSMSLTQTAKASNNQNNPVGSYLRQFVKQTGLQEIIAEQMANAQIDHTENQHDKPPLPDYPISHQPLQKQPPVPTISTTPSVPDVQLSPSHQFDHQSIDKPTDYPIDEMNMTDDKSWAYETLWNDKPRWDDDSGWNSNEKKSFTPNNTPPTNPLKPHQEHSLTHKEDSERTAKNIEHVNMMPKTKSIMPKSPESEQTNISQTKINHDALKKRTPPNIRFDVPDVAQSNLITDMVNDDDDDNNNDDNNGNNMANNHMVMPDIHDDMAFAGKSRAMHTAKYRANLPTLPPLNILDKPDPNRKPSYTAQELRQLSELLEIKLQDFNVKADVVNAIPGPVVTRFEVELAAGVKASKVVSISRDLARSLSMASLRVVEVIPGKPYIGIEVPNRKREMVRLIELLATDKYKDPKGQISMAMGKDIGGKPIITDLAKAPHMLVAGTTGSGKSVLVNAMLLSILLKYTPEQLRLILIDPKQLELANYNDIPHLLTPVVTDMTEAASSLSWCVAEMERRYQLMSLLKVRKLKEFNKKVIAAEQAGTPIIDPLWRPNDSVSIDKAPKLKTLPMIVIVADEFADMMMQVGKQAEELITRLAQKSRAAGIHLMLATQRPSVDVITGLIKANVPVRVALRVNSKVDSRTILDSGGAEDMLGNGDMLFLGPGQIEPERVHGAFVSDEEVNRVCEAWRERGAPDYIDNFSDNFNPIESGSGGNNSGEDDDLYNEAVAFVMETRKVSASSLQRKFSIGYNRAARIVDSMEEAGLISPMDKSGKRELLF